MPFTLTDAYSAFRQAKIALYFEQRGIGLLELARFEEDLPRRLERTLEMLNSSQGLFDQVPLGHVWLVPKRVNRTAQAEDGSVRIGVRAKRQERPSLEVQVRISPSPELAIAEIIYLWKYGPTLDALLSPACIGYRLDTRRGSLSRSRRWVYEYWPPRYQEFRTAPIKAARDRLGAGAHSVTILSADLASFYDSIGTDFLLTEDFVRRLQQKASERTRRLSVSGYRRDTASLIRYYDRFREYVGARLGEAWTTGVPIGGLTSRLVANLALAPLDTWILEQPDTILFRRYVDDMVIVNADRGLVDQSSIEAIKALMPVAESSSGVVRLDTHVLKRPDSSFEIQLSKLKVHHLSGVAGQQFLKSVGDDFLALVSERRAFLDGALVGDDAASHLARAVGKDGSALRALRDADRVKLERFALSTSLRSLDRISALVSASDAKRAARNTQARVQEVVDEDTDWFAEIDLLFRLLALAFASDDGESIRELLTLTEKLWGDRAALETTFETMTHRGRIVTRRAAWKMLRAYLDARRRETVAGSVRPQQLARGNYLPNGLRIGDRRLSADRVDHIARQLALADLRANDREDDCLQVQLPRTATREFDDLPIRRELHRRFAAIGQFVTTCRRLGDHAWALPPHRLFLLTRPPSYFDIARRMLYRTEQDGFTSGVFDDLLQIVNAIRGTQYSDAIGRVVNPGTVEIPAVLAGLARLQQLRSGPQIILGNLTVDQECWTGSASRDPSSPTGKPVLTVTRLQSLNAVLKRATLAAAGRPRQSSLLVLPELSLPRAWLRAVATYVVTRLNMGLIAGVEYLHDPKMPWVMNQVIGAFPGPRRSVATWPWTKRVPAREEAAELARCNPPVSYRPKVRQSAKRTVVRSLYGDLSVLICSELIEARRVADLLGRVELVIVPSWNKDTSSYDHLIQSAGLQLNAIVAVANNGTTSDCRAWAPLADRWRRDLCRVIARGADDTIAVDLPLAALRTFRKTPGPDSPWRPMPPDWP